MHELAICQSLVEQLRAIADQHPGTRIAVIHLLIGPLSGIDPELLKRSFPFASVGTPAEHAVLDCTSGQVRVYCPDCARESEVRQNRLICPCCDNWRTELRSGDELVLQRVELDEISRNRELAC
jgi:hydrogenase nickel incorporation protein HypA/HybF